MEPRDKDVK
jgi:hypothetical protein